VQKAPGKRTLHEKRLTIVALLDTLSNMDEKLRRFGEFIQAARKRAGLTLRAAEEATGISNAYLSQLEQGKIKQPSPTTLHKLSDVYQIAYEDLFRLVGYPIPGATDTTEETAGFASRIGPVTSEEEKSLIEYLEFLRSREKR